MGVDELRGVEVVIGMIGGELCFILVLDEAMSGRYMSLCLYISVHVYLDMPICVLVLVDLIKRW